MANSSVQFEQQPQQSPTQPVAHPSTSAQRQANKKEAARRVKYPATDIYVTKLNVGDEEPPPERPFSHWDYVRNNRPKIIEFGRKERLRDATPALEPERVLRLPATNQDDMPMRNAIPYLPLPVALFCATANLAVPGLGTVLCGWLGLCFGRCRVPGKGNQRVHALMTNMLIGFCQFTTVIFFLVGWFWSVVWSGLILVHSMEYHRAHMKLAAAKKADKVFKANKQGRSGDPRQMLTAVKAARAVQNGNVEKG